MFDQTTGNLIYRKDVKRGFTQTFGYDDLNRLTTITPTYTTAVAGFPSAVTIFYAINGNIQSKSDVSGENYVYEKGRPNSVEFVLNSAVINPKTQVINYNAFDKIEEITETIVKDEQDYENRLLFYYGVEETRKKTEAFVNNTKTCVKYYSINYEKEIHNPNTPQEYTRELSFLGNAVVIKDSRYINEYPAGRLYYILTDHLGSITGLVGEDGTLAEEYSYDAWGRRRDPSNWTTVYNNSTNQQFNNSLISRGYTGHEHLDMFGLINMNGRLYDPLLGRMLSPDNFVQSPMFSQSYNRFAYCANNPLKYFDPNGETPEPIFLGYVFYIPSLFNPLLPKYIPFYQLPEVKIEDISLWPVSTTPDPTITPLNPVPGGGGGTGDGSGVGITTNPNNDKPPKDEKKDPWFIELSDVIANTTLPVLDVAAKTSNFNIPGLTTASFITNSFVASYNAIHYYSNPSHTDIAHGIKYSIDALLPLYCYADPITGTIVNFTWWYIDKSIGWGNIYNHTQKWNAPQYFLQLNHSTIDPSMYIGFGGIK